MRQQLYFRHGDYVVVSGRPGRVRGSETVKVADRRISVLTVEVLGLSAAVVQVPLSRVDLAVERITEGQAMSLAANPPPLGFSTRWRTKTAKSAAMPMHRQADFGRIGGLRKAANRARVA